MDGRSYDRPFFIGAPFQQDNTMRFRLRFAFVGFALFGALLLALGRDSALASKPSPDGASAPAIPTTSTSALPQSSATSYSPITTPTGSPTPVYRPRALPGMASVVF